MKEDDETDKLVVDIDLASSLKAAFCAARWSEEQIKMLARSEHFRNLRSVIEGCAEINPRRFTVDLGAVPPPPEHPQHKFVLHKHTGTGTVTVVRREDKLFLDGKKVNLFVWKGQRRGCFSGEIEKAVRRMKVLDFNLGQFLVKHPFMVPRQWYRFREIFFWGTTYKNDTYGEYVSSLQLSNIADMSMWCEHIQRGDSGGVILSDCPSAVLEQ